MSRIDGLEYSVKIFNNKIYSVSVVNRATFYLRMNIFKYLTKTIHNIFC